MNLIPIAHAHEVYVLEQSQIVEAVREPSPNPFTAISGHELTFLAYAFGIALVLIAALSLSVSKVFEKVCDPLLMKLKKYAPFAARLTLGSSLFISGYHGALFGPELPLSHILPPGIVAIGSWFLMLGGLSIIFGFLTRYIVAIAAFIYGLAIYKQGFYMVNYVNYLGEMILFLILGSGIWSFDKARMSPKKFQLSGFAKKCEPYAFLILRILTGAAILFASTYAKLVHSNLALDTVMDYNLTHYFPFTPLFLVLGAFLIESLVAVFIALGIELRLMMIIFTVFLTLSINFFGESVWPHLVLFGTNLVIFMHGYDKYTIECWLFDKKGKREPVL